MMTMSAEDDVGLLLDSLATPGLPLGYKFDSPEPTEADADSPGFVFGVPTSEFTSATAATASADDLSSASTPSPELGAAPPPPATVAPSDLLIDTAVTAATTTPAAPRKKRRKAEDSPAAEQAAAALAAEIGVDSDLLALTTEEIETLISARKAAAALEPEQERRLRRIRRLIKNREYAQSSRDKRKAASDGMERENAHLRDENRALRDRIATLERENAQLRALLPSQQSPPPSQQHGVARAACLLAVCLLGLGLFLAVVLQPQTELGGAGSLGGGATEAAGRTLKSTAETHSFLWALPRYLSLRKIFGGNVNVDAKQRSAAMDEDAVAPEYWEWLGRETGVSSSTSEATSDYDAMMCKLRQQEEEEDDICEWQQEEV